MSLFDKMNDNKVKMQPNTSNAANAATAVYGSSAPATTSTDATNKLIRNTYTLLSITLLFSAVMAGVSIAINMPPFHWLLYLAGFIGLLLLTYALRNSVWGLVSVFALTGFLGLNTGGIINIYLSHFVNGHFIVLMAFGMTAAIFLGLSGYALTTKKDFSFLGAFLFAGIIVVLVAAIANIFFQIPALALALSAVMVLLMAGYILYDTSNMVHGYETNYIMATINLYVDIYILFLNLLQLLGAFFGEE